MGQLAQVLGNKKRRTLLRNLTGDRAQLIVNYMHSVCIGSTTLLTVIADFIHISNS